MKYISQINAFWIWRESNPLGTSAIALWFALMDTANRAGWPRDFSVAISTLRSKTGMSKDAIYRARNQLQQKERLCYKERKGNLSTIYQLIPFEEEKSHQFSTGFFTNVSTNNQQNFPQVELAAEFQTQSATQTATQSATQTATQTATNNRLEKKREYNGGDGGARAGAEEINPSNLFSRYFGREPLPAETQQCEFWLTSRDPELVEHAFFRACTADKKNLGYVSGVLEKLWIRGITDMGGLAEYDISRAKKGRR